MIFGTIEVYPVALCEDEKDILDCATNIIDVLIEGMETRGCNVAECCAEFHHDIHELKDCLELLKDLIELNEIMVQ